MKFSISNLNCFLCLKKVSEKIPLMELDEKYDRVLAYCEKEVDRILKLYRKQKDDPPVPRNFPPIAGSKQFSLIRNVFRFTSVS